MKVGIVGSRNPYKMNVRKMKTYIPIDCTCIISGGAIGIDSIAKEYASVNGVDYLEILPNYEVFGKKAPLIRNTKIVEMSQNIIAFWDYKSKGTAFTIRECIRLDVPVRIVSLLDI